MEGTPWVMMGGGGGVEIVTMVTERGFLMMTVDTKLRKYRIEMPTGTQAQFVRNKLPIEMNFGGWEGQRPLESKKGGTLSTRLLSLRFHYWEEL